MRVVVMIITAIYNIIVIGISLRGILSDWTGHSVRDGEAKEWIKRAVLSSLFLLSQLE